MRRNLVIGGALAAVLVLVAGVTVAVSPTVRQQLGLSDPPAAATQAEPIPGADLSGTGPGSLISAMTMPVGVNAILMPKGSNSEPTQPRLA